MTEDTTPSRVPNRMTGFCGSISTVACGRPTAPSSLR